MNNENDEMDLLQQELSNILKQLQNEMDGTTELEIEEIHGVNLKELEKAFSEKEPKLDLKFVKCHADAVSPSYNYPTDSGFDLHSTESTMIPPLSRMVVGTGLRNIEIVKRVDDISHGIQATRNAFATCWFDEAECKDGILHLDSYKKMWSETNQRFTDTPKHDIHSEAADAFRQFAQGYEIDSGDDDYDYDDEPQTTNSRWA